MDNLTALLDSLDAMIAQAPSSLFLRNRARLKRSEVKALVAQMGDAIEAQKRLGEREDSNSPIQALVAATFEAVEYLANSGGAGGAAYRMRYLDMNRKDLAAAVEALRTASDLAGRAAVSADA